MIELQTVAGSPLASASLLAVENGSFRILNTYAYSVVVKVCLAGNDGKAAADCSDVEGKEIALEGWVSVRPLAGGAWTQINEPATFPDSFDDLTDGCYVATIAAGAYLDLETQLVIPDGFATSGLAHFSIMVMGAAA